MKATLEFDFEEEADRYSLKRAIAADDAFRVIDHVDNKLRSVVKYDAVAELELEEELGRKLTEEELKIAQLVASQTRKLITGACNQFDVDMGMYYQ